MSIAHAAAGLGLLFAAFILVLLPGSVEAKLFGLGLSLLLSFVASTLDYLRLRAKERRKTGPLSDP